MNTRLRVSILLVLLALHSVIGAIETSASKSGAQKLKALDDLYIDDEGEDDIQLQDEASGSGPTHQYEPNLAEEDEEEEEDDYDDYEDNGDVDTEDEYRYPEIEEAEESQKERKTEAITTTTTTTTTTSTAATPSRSREQQLLEEDEFVTPRVSPVAISPPHPPLDYDDENFEDDYGSGSGASATDDEDDRESVESDDYDDEDTFNLNSVTGETDPTDTHVFDDVEEEEEEEESNPEVVVPTPAPSTEAPPHQPDVVVPPQQPESPVVETPVDGTVPKHNVPDETPHTTDRGTHPVDASGGVAKAGDRQASFFAQPGILAAVIGGAVVGLLCAILLVMFIVYRMRKKDEGSYALEEPKRNSPNSHPYNKSSREFYA